MIRFENVYKVFGDHTALDGVSLVVEPSVSVAVVGKSGSGKSTLLRTINRIIEPTSGTILVDGQNVSTIDPVLLRRQIGYVIQGVGLFPHWTVGRNIGAVPEMLGWDDTRIKARAEELLELFGMDPAIFMERYPDQLSGGQQQRIGVARALAANPAVVLMDEPFGALDPITRRQAQNELKNIRAKFRTTIIIVTHDIEEALMLGDRVAVMEAGQIVQYDTPFGVLREPASPLIASLLGGNERAFGLLSVSRVNDFAVPGYTDGPSIAPTATLREALALLLLHGVDRLAVEAEGDAHPRHLMLHRVLEVSREPS